MNSQKPPFTWYIRKFVWDSISIIIFRGKKAKKIPMPPKIPQPLLAVPLSKRIPGVQVNDILMADRIPTGEYSLLMHYVFSFRIWLSRIYPPVRPGLPQIAADSSIAMSEAYTRRYQKVYKAPKLPKEYQNAGIPDIGILATTSPYACFLEKDDEGRLVWDFRDLDDHEIYPGLRPLGCRVFFSQDKSEKRLRAERIECVLGDIGADEERFNEAARTALCAASTQISLVNHFNWVHLACGGPFAIATRNNLGYDHPLCRLMWPHMFGTQNSNYLVTKGQMLRGGDFETVFSFTHAGMCDLFARTYNGYRASVIVPELDWRDRGLDELEIDTPVQDNLIELYDVMFAHTHRYIQAYYPNDAALQQDEPAQAWLRALDLTIPNGIKGITGGEVTREGVARLCAGFIFMASVQHEALGSLMWNYQMWVDKNPVRIHTDGRRIPVDVLQRLLNANFNLNVDRAKLMQDFSYMAKDAKGEAIFLQFLEELRALDSKLAKLEKEEPTCWRVTPRMLDANINA